MSSQHPSRDNGLPNYLEISKNGLPQKPTLKPTPKPNARAKGKGKAIEDASTGATASASATAGASASSDANIDPSLDTPIDQQNPYERELDEIDSLIQTLLFPWPNSLISTMMECLLSSYVAPILLRQDVI